ncbi:hypothetical protein GQ44DRAFT_733460 [Phaeosphaeriaceae sp. PMI808]|nr:hypothetical protein GQ44DRAFT_734009 [Phaeosphaeriaceae sp. PMI808]KAH8698034.1 hypothetical protein GQ44DRAFT_733460 [Phaeosphaeriaceae sp. PMI808]
MAHTIALNHPFIQSGIGYPRERQLPPPPQLRPSIEQHIRTLEQECAALKTTCQGLCKIVLEVQELCRGMNKEFCRAKDDINKLVRDSFNGQEQLYQNTKRTAETIGKELGTDLDCKIGQLLEAQQQQQHRKGLEQLVQTAVEVKLEAQLSQFISKACQTIEIAYGREAETWQKTEPVSGSNPDIPRHRKRMQQRKNSKRSSLHRQKTQAAPNGVRRSARITYAVKSWGTRSSYGYDIHLRVRIWYDSNTPSLPNMNNELRSR